MAGCLLAVISYLPIYGALQRIAGNNVTNFSSQKNPVTGAVTLTSKTVDASGKTVTAPEAARVKPEIGNPYFWQMVLLVFIQVIFVTMVYGPIAAYLVEAFPAKIRYTSLSLPYHIGNGVFGGLVPLIGSYMGASFGLYSGLYYPMIIASITFVVGSIYLKETRQVEIWTEVAEAKTSAAR